MLNTRIILKLVFKEQRSNGSIYIFIYIYKKKQTRGSFTVRRNIYIMLKYIFGSFRLCFRVVSLDPT